jgi:hypothetical protein
LFVAVLNPATDAERSSSMSTLVVARYIGVVVKVRTATARSTRKNTVMTM